MQVAFETESLPVNSRIVPVSIPYYKDSSRIRWFLEVQDSTGRWHEIGNSEDKEEMIERLARVVLIYVGHDNWSWTVGPCDTVDKSRE
jgi:hypothetical protein